jgi:hypothetical protein
MVREEETVQEEMVQGEMVQGETVQEEMVRETVQVGVFRRHLHHHRLHRRHRLGCLAGDENMKLRGVNGGSIVQRNDECLLTRSFG